jgi:hypothetical protein
MLHQWRCNHEADGDHKEQRRQQIGARSLTDGDEHRGYVDVVLGGGVRGAYAQPGDMVSMRVVGADGG